MNLPGLKVEFGQPDCWFTEPKFESVGPNPLPDEPKFDPLGKLTIGTEEVIHKCIKTNIYILF